jgi:hypothetical protein
MSFHGYATNRGHTRGPVHRLVSFLGSIVAQCLFPTASAPSALHPIDVLTQGSLTRERSVDVQEESDKEERQRTLLHCIWNNR